MAKKSGSGSSSSSSSTSNSSSNSSGSSSSSSSSSGSSGNNSGSGSNNNSDGSSGNGSGSGYTGSRIEGNDVVHYNNGVETYRNELYGDSGSGSSNNQGGSSSGNNSGSGSGSGTGGSSTGGSSGSGDGGRSTIISSIRNACQSIRTAVSSLVSGVRQSISNCRDNLSTACSQAADSIKAVTKTLLPQENKAKSNQIADSKSDGPGPVKQDSQADPKPNQLESLVQNTMVSLKKGPEDSKKDPVIKSSGINRQTNTDLTLGTFGGSYAVTRHHAPRAGRGGLLGTSWASGLDTRIIRGQEADRSEEIQKLREALADIRAKKAEIEALDSSYEEVKDDIAAALAEADSAIASITSEIAPLEAAQSAAERDRERNSYVLYGGAEAFAGCGAGRLVLMKDGFIPLLFERAEDGSYRGTGAGRLLTIEETAGGYALTNPDGSTQEFDAYGRLAGETDRNGSAVRIVWGADGRIEEIISPAGCSAKIQSDEAGRITAMSLLQDGEETGRSVSYSYSGDSLSAMTDTDGDTTRYEYDDALRLTAIVKGDGSAMRYVYTQCADGSVRVASVTDEEGQVMAFSHDPAARRFSYKPAGGEEEISFYDAEGRITREESGGLVTEYGYDADGNVTSRTVNGERTEYAYDKDGNLTKALYSDGSTERGKKLRQAICDKFNFATLEFQSLEGVIRAIGLNPCELCTYCWNGKE